MQKAITAVRDAVERSSDHALVFDVARQLLAILGPCLPATGEVILHDFSRLPNSVILVHGNLTGRCIGGPPNDHLVRHLAEGRSDDLINQRVMSADGRALQCSTVMLRGRAGEPIGALCFNNDASDWEAVQGAATRMLREGESASISEPPMTIAGVSEQIVSTALGEVGRPVELMSKEHKLQVVRALQERGFFHLRDAAETAANLLHVTRFTIYNYLKEL